MRIVALLSLALFAAGCSACSVDPVASTSGAVAGGPVQVVHHAVIAKAPKSKGMVRARTDPGGVRVTVGGYPGRCKVEPAFSRTVRGQEIALVRLPSPSDAEDCPGNHSMTLMLADVAPGDWTIEVQLADGAAFGRAVVTVPAR